MKDEIDTAMDFLTPSSTFHKQAPVINHIRRQQRYRQSDCMEIQIVTFEEQATAICNIRRAVFVDEQGIALEAEFDDSDKICIHVLALENGRPVGTARMKRNGRIGRLAVLKDGRLCGIGSAIMRTLEQYARMKQIDRLWLHAQVRAVGFYERLGYRAVGPVFMEENISHRLMEKGI